MDEAEMDVVEMGGRSLASHLFSDGGLHVRSIFL